MAHGVKKLNHVSLPTINWLKAGYLYEFAC